MAVGNGADLFVVVAAVATVVEVVVFVQSFCQTNLQKDHPKMKVILSIVESG